MNTPVWALTTAYWLHMLATVIWIGGLAALSILVLPVARQSMDRPAYARLLDSLQRRLDPLGWFSLVLLVATGLVQMSANPNYEGFLAMNNRWAIAILLKHIVLLGMAGISAAMTWGILPRLRRAALLQARGQDAPEAGRLHRREVLLLRLNLILGVVVLALTAVARVS